MTSPVVAQYPYERTSVAGPPADRPRVLFDFHTIVVPGTRVYEWNVTARLDNYADDGDQCASYFQGWKHAAGNTFTVVFEGQDFHEGVADSGPLLPVEVDFMGARGRRTRGCGLLLVVGRSGPTPERDPNDKGVAHLPYFARLVPFDPDRGYVKVDGFIRMEMVSEEAIISMQGGDAIRLSDDPAVAEFGFDVATGITGLWFRKRRFCLRGWNNTTGQEYVNWQSPV